MDRLLIEKLIEWKQCSTRKPLLLMGARQTGKTWLLKEFGRTYYQNVAYIDLLANRRLRTIFDDDFDTNRIITALSVEAGVHIQPEQTLVILDEIQEAPRALTSLKYFCQDAPQYHIAAAGSYLGIASHEGVSYPVGKVNTLTLEPMSFREYLYAVEETVAADVLGQQGASGIDVCFVGKMENHLRNYLYVGGMPEAVQAFALRQNYSEVRRIQQEILDAYDHDFSKHAPVRILERMRLVWESLPAQLAKENKKFVYGAVRPGARARDFEESIQWLVDYGVVRRVSRVSALRIPLSGYRDDNAFKLFCVDVGLLGALAHVPMDAVISQTRLFTEFKGALTEQYVCQQLASIGKSAAYWSSDTGQAEVDFAVEVDGNPLPVEVKAAENLRSRSLKVARDKFNLDRCARTSLSGYRNEGWLVNIPLWAIETLDTTLSLS